MLKIDKITNGFVTEGGVHQAIDTMNPSVTLFQSVIDCLLSEGRGIDSQLAYIPTSRIVSTHPNLPQLAQKSSVTRPISQLRK